MAVKNRDDAPRILVIGGAYAGLSFITYFQNLLKGKPEPTELIPGLTAYATIQIPPKITLLDARDGFFHSMSSPLAHVSIDYMPKAWQTYSTVASLIEGNVQVIQGKATGVDLASKIATYQSHDDNAIKQISYDYLVIATGTQRSWPVVTDALHREQYLSDATAHIKSIRDARKVVVVGGGAVGVEFASHIKQTYHDKHVTLVHSRDTLLSVEPLPREFMLKAAELLQEEGVEVILNSRAVGEEEGQDGHKTRIKLSTGDFIDADKIIYTVQPHTSTTTYLPTEALDEHGYIKVQPSLQFPATLPNAESHYGAGDAIVSAGIKRVGGALRHGQYAAQNIFLQISQSQSTHEESNQAYKFVHAPEGRAGMGLSVAGKALISPTGDPNLLCDVIPHEDMFGHELGLESCTRYMGLKQKKET